MNRPMVDALLETFSSLERGGDVRAVVIRGADGHFCAGGDVSEMAGALMQPPADGVDPLFVLNRRFGEMLQAVDSAPVVVVAICEGGVMGGGFGLACVADVTLAVSGARFRLPETGLGITPAQIAPFVVRRLGLSQARRLAVTGAALSAEQAVTLGLGHESVAPDAVDAWLGETLAGIRKCEPLAVAYTKQLMSAAAPLDLGALLDRAATDFATIARGPTAMAGFQAFMQRKPPPWAEEG
jgi:isohexenylglutaconyl-CoA hydratase